MAFVRVAVNFPLHTLFDYSASDVTAEDIGRRAIVPFGKKTTVGVIVTLTDTPDIPESQIKAIAQILRDGARVPPDTLRLLEFSSRYYCYPLGQTIFCALPPALRRARALHITPRACFQLTDGGRSARPHARALRLRRALEAFHQHRSIGAGSLAVLGRGARRLLKELAERGWIERIDEPHPPAQCAIEPQVEPALTREQDQAVSDIGAQLDRFGVWLLHGVTGSGKTEVYLRLVARVLARGAQALVLVPEITLTPQLEATFRARFPQVVQTSLHSALPERERSERWLEACSGRAQIVLGTRLSVFTPLPDLGLIVVDEEHDASFKQQEGLRYSARDLAIYRARERGVPIVLGSATPSIESYYQGLRGRYRLVALRERARERALLPQMHLIDLRQNKTQHGISAPLLESLSQRLQLKQQSLIFINRRGYAPVLYCPHCAWTSGCPRCSVKLVFHQQRGQLCCHHCGHVEPPPLRCPGCGNQDLRAVGEGTQRIEQALQREFPSARILRVDRDSTRGREAWLRVVSKVEAGEADILVGTQLLSKGHDFPNITLVGMINVDTALVSPDFRASERLFAQLVQVAGRAGRAQTPGEVLVQTEFPGHPLFDMARHYDYAGFAQWLLPERKAIGFPPFVHQALLRVESVNAEAAQRFAAWAVNKGRQLKFAVTVYEAVSALIARVAGKTRMQVLVQSASRATRQAFLQAWHEELAQDAARKVRWAIDVDPYEL